MSHSGHELLTPPVDQSIDQSISQRLCLTCISLAVEYWKSLKMLSISQ